MRRISLTLVAAMLFFTGSVLGNSSNQTNPDEKLKKFVKERLDDYHTKPDSDLTAKILFFINQEHEIVVLSVDTADPDFEGWIKNKLNYLVVESDVTREIGRFTISVRLLS